MEIAVRGTSRLFVDGVVRGTFHTSDTTNISGRMELAKKIWVSIDMHIRTTVDSSGILVVKYDRDTTGIIRTRAGLQKENGPEETRDGDTEHKPEVSLADIPARNVLRALSAYFFSSTGIKSESEDLFLFSQSREMESCDFGIE